MSAPEAFFIPDGDCFVATELTRGPWSPDLEHGGPPAALLARAIERLAGDEVEVARLSVEFLRPIPIAPLTVAASPIRTGKKVQVIGASLASGGREMARATAVCIRRARLALPPVVPGDRWVPEPPERCAPFEFPFFVERVGYHKGVELRLARGEFGRGAMAAWMRLRAPIVAGEAPSPIQLVVAVADSGNGVSVALDLLRFTFVNPDLTVYVHRPLEGEWVCLDATTVAQPGGMGLAEAALHDVRGPLGRSLQSLILEERPG